MAQTDGGPSSRSDLPGTAPVAQLDRAGGFYPSGCGFDSCRGRRSAVQTGCDPLPRPGRWRCWRCWRQGLAPALSLGTRSAFGTTPLRASAIARSLSSVAYWFPRAADGEEWPLRSINSPVLAPVATAMVSEKCRRSWKCTRDSQRAVRAFPMLAPALLADEGHHRVRCTGGHPGWTDLPVRVVDLLVGPKCFSVTAAGNRRLRLSVREDAHFIHAVQSLLHLAPGTLRVVIGVPAFPRLGSVLPLTLLCHANRTQLSCGGTAGAGLILR